MPHIQDRRERDFSVYDSMSDEDLEQLLRDDFSKPEGEEFDTDILLYITEVLAKRRKDRNEGRSPAQAWESFKQNYYTENENSYVSENVPVAQERKNSGRWRRGLIAAAAVLVLIIGTSVTVSAFKFDLWGAIAKWTQETFHFGSATQPTVPADPGKSDSQVYTGLQDALKNFNILLPLAPTWLPDGYVEDEIRFEEMPTERLFVAQYKRGDESIRVRIAAYADSDKLQIEQSDSLIEVYTVEGIDYYIFDNEGQLQAVWINENFECYISGPLTISELRRMIDSIEKG